jgi:hypothetical protein
MSGRVNLLWSFVFGAGFAVAMVAIILASGATFGSRCARAFPTDPARAELCVHNLSKGNAP